MNVKHSGPGIASLLLSVISGVLLIALIVVMMVVEESTPGALTEDSPEMEMVGFSFLGCYAGFLLALVLAFVGLLQTNRKKEFAILGMVCSASALVGLTILLLFAFVTQ